MKELDEEAIEEAALLVAEQFGIPDWIQHADYGVILCDGKLTEAGIQWYKDHFEQQEEEK